MDKLRLVWIGVLCWLLASATGWSQVPALAPSPEMSDAQLLDTVQYAGFRYFTDYADVKSGMAKERWTGGHYTTVTTGGTGFGLMALVVGAERGWLEQDQLAAQVEKIVAFLERVPRFHGAWAHWYNGETGTVSAFSANDDGADLVETGFLVAGLLAVREYYKSDPKFASRKPLADRITQLCDGVEWDWFSRGNALWWHWSVNHDFGKLRIGGYNECFIVYILAMGANQHAISAEVFQKGWYGGSYNSKPSEFMGYQIPFGSSKMGPLFFAHYSYLGVDPRWMEDRFTNYWRFNTIHTLTNRAYCLEQAPKEFQYSERSWGLTASSGINGYGVHFPGNDTGTVAPTAALSSMPYTPYFSMQMLRGLVDDLGGKSWGDYGPYDAYNLSKDWYRRAWLAIDQGPIVVMIENYRSGLFWKLLMKAPEVRRGLQAGNLLKQGGKSGFEYAVAESRSGMVYLQPHPDSNFYSMDYWLAEEGERISIDLLDKDGKLLRNVEQGQAPKPGVYRCMIARQGEVATGDYKLRFIRGDGSEQIIAVRFVVSSVATPSGGTVDNSRGAVPERGATPATGRGANSERGAVPDRGAERGATR